MTNTYEAINIPNAANPTQCWVRSIQTSDVAEAKLRDGNKQSEKNRKEVMRFTISLKLIIILYDSEANADNSSPKRV